MFRQKKIGDRLPLSTGVGEGSHRLKKILKILLISSICIILALCPLSVSALSSNGITFSAGVGRMFVPNVGGYYLSNGSTENNRLYWNWSSPVSGYTIDSEFIVSINLSSSFYGSLKMSFYCEGVTLNPPVTSGTSVSGEPISNLNGLYANGSYSPLTVEGNRFIVEYTGRVPQTVELRGYFSTTFDSNWKIVIELDEVEVDFLVDSDGIINSQNENTDKVISNQNENTDKIVGAIGQQQENEKQEANNSGNSATDSLNSAIPDYTSNLLEAFIKLCEPLIHEDTHCSIVIPAIKTPKLKIASLGINIDEITLMEEKAINLNTYYQDYIPNYIQNIVSWTLTIALLIYCLKEFYGIIEYILTLKGGN